MRSLLTILALAAAVVTLYCAATPAPASAALPRVACKAAGEVSGLAGKACDLLGNPKKLLNIGKNFVTGHLGSVLSEIFGGGGPPGVTTALSLAAIVAWITEGAKTAIGWMVKQIQSSAAPQLGSIWFSSTYWRVAGMAALLTLPFLFAAAVQALIRSDLTVLSRAAFGYLPLAMLCVAIAAPLTMLLLAGTDELCSLVWSPSSSHGLTTLLTKASGVVGLAVLVKSRFLAFLLGLLAAGGATLVWLELLMREAAVYVVVLLLPLAFAALVWPARRVWALRSLELLVALILSKFAIVAVLGLGGAALDHAGSHGVGAVLAGMVLVILAAFAPWAVLRLVPLAEVASGAAGALRSHTMAPITGAWERSKDEDRNAGAVMTNLRSRLVFATPGAEGNAALGNGGVSSDNGATGPLADPPPDDDGAGLPGVDPDHEAHTATDAVNPVSGGGTVNSSAPGVSSQGAVPSAERGPAVQPDERIPGAAPMWQADDMSWRPLTLGLDEGWPPPPLWTEQGIENTSASENSPEVDEPDPLPPEQEPGGRL